MKILLLIVVAGLLAGGGTYAVGTFSGSEMERVCRKDTPTYTFPFHEKPTYNRITTHDGSELTVADRALFDSLKTGTVYTLSHTGKYDLGSTILNGATPVADPAVAATVPPCSPAL